MSANQFVLVFQSRTLVSAQRLVDIAAQREATIYMQRVLKGGTMRRGSRGYGQLGHSAVGVASRGMGRGSLQLCSNMLMMVITSSFLISSPVRLVV